MTPTACWYQSMSSSTAASDTFEYALCANSVVEQIEFCVCYVPQRVLLLYERGRGGRGECVRWSGSCRICRGGNWRAEAAALPDRDRGLWQCALLKRLAHIPPG